MKDVIDWLAYMEHFQSVLKEFDTVVTHSDKFFMKYFRNGLRPSIHVQLDEKNHGLDNWQEVIKRAVDIKIKALH